MKLSDTKVLIVDEGILGVMIANAIANDFKKVYYWKHWLSAFPKPHEQWIGKGIPGITRVDSYEDTKEEILKDKGIFVFPDVGRGDQQKELRNMGARVFGAGESGELEMNRTLFKDTLKNQGLAVPKYGIVIGTDALEKLLRKEDELWIKLDVEMRGIMETCYHEKWETSREWFYKLVHDLSCFRDTTRFMWEKPIPGIEPGSDIFICQGIPFKEGLLGIENKGDGYICKHMSLEDMPPPLKKVHTAMLPVEKKYKTSGAISTEVRVGEDKIPYFIDACRRFGNPPGATISVIYKNLAQIIEGIADGKEITPEWAAEYAAEISIDARDGDMQSIPMELTEKDLKRIKLRAACRIEDIYYTIPFKEIGTTIVKAVGIGDSREEAEMDCLEIAKNFTDKVKGASFNTSTFDNLEETITGGKKYGIDSEKF